MSYKNRLSELKYEKSEKKHCNKPRSKPALKAFNKASRRQARKVIEEEIIEEVVGVYLPPLTDKQKQRKNKHAYYKTAKIIKLLREYYEEVG